MSIAQEVIKKICPICNKEFELSYNQRVSYHKNENYQFCCSRECRAKQDSINKTIDRPTLKCYICGKEFKPSNDQLTKYNKNPDDLFFCSRSCTGKYSNSKMDYEKRNEQTKKLYEDKEWVAKRTAKTKQTCIEKYGVDNPSKSQEVKNKIEEVMLERYGEKHYNNRQKYKETIANMSEEQKQLWQQRKGKSIKDTISKRTTSRWASIKKKLSYAQKENWLNMTDEERHNFYVNSNAISKRNKEVAYIIGTNVFEKSIGRYSFDLFKEPNILIEIDPIVSHNYLYAYEYLTKLTTKNNPLSKTYHKDKSDFAKQNGYRCIHVYDWDNIKKIKYLIQDKEILYARKLDIKEVSKEECDNFLNNYHIQETCRNQDIRLGLYKDNELIQIMTFGKPRYNKNYQYELLRLCTHKDYKVVGGSQKLFSYFIKNYNPDSIVSYCDNNKFNGDVYSKLGFTFKTISINKHWCKGNAHITDNLLRQRGYDQLFGTNYGKGSSNEELMLDNGWLPLYDAGQSTYIWNK